MAICTHRKEGHRNRWELNYRVAHSAVETLMSSAFSPLFISLSPLTIINVAHRKVVYQGM